MRVIEPETDWDAEGVWLRVAVWEEVIEVEGVPVGDTVSVRVLLPETDTVRVVVGEAVTLREVDMVKSRLVVGDCVLLGEERGLPLDVEELDAQRV